MVQCLLLRFWNPLECDSKWRYTCQHKLVWLVWPFVYKIVETCINNDLYQEVSNDTLNYTEVTSRQLWWIKLYFSYKSLTQPTDLFGWKWNFVCVSFFLSFKIDSLCSIFLPKWKFIDHLWDLSTHFFYYRRVYFDEIHYQGHWSMEYSRIFRKITVDFNVIMEI